MSVQAVNAGGNIAEILGVIAREAQEAIATILRKGTNADVTNHVEGIVKQAKRLDSTPLVPSKVQPISPYASPDVPSGYNTILGYLAESNPNIFLIVKKPEKQWETEELWLQQQAYSRGLLLYKVDACPYLKKVGHVHSFAYPISLLKERVY